MITSVLVLASMGILACILLADGDRVSSFFVGLLLILAVMVFAVLDHMEHTTKDCESKLPRNQECKLIAVPVEIKETIQEVK